MSEFFFLLAWQWRVDAPFAVTVAFDFLFLCLEWNKKLNSVCSTPVSVADTVELNTFVNWLFTFYLTGTWCHVASRHWSCSKGRFAGIPLPKFLLNVTFYFDISFVRKIVSSIFQLALRNFASPGELSSKFPRINVTRTLRKSALAIPLALILSNWWKKSVCVRFQLPSWCKFTIHVLHKARVCPSVSEKSANLVGCTLLCSQEPVPKEKRKVGNAFSVPFQKIYKCTQLAIH